MNIRFRTKFQVRRGASPSPDTVLLKVKGYGHQVSVDLFELDTDLTGPNFNHVDYYDQFGRWNAVTKFYNDVQDVLPWLKSLHPSWTQPMENWLIGDTTGGDKPSRPMWWAEKNGVRVLRCGTSCFGENLVMVEAVNGKPVEYTFRDSYPGINIVVDIPFVRVIGMRRSDIGKVTHQSHPWFIHRANQAANNIVDWYPKGTTIYYPILDYADWGINTKVTRMFLPKVLCGSV